MIYTNTYIIMWNVHNNQFKCFFFIIMLVDVPDEARRVADYWVLQDQVAGTSEDMTLAGHNPRVAAEVRPELHHKVVHCSPAAAVKQY